MLGAIRGRGKKDVTAQKETKTALCAARSCEADYCLLFSLYLIKTSAAGRGELWNPKVLDADTAAESAYWKKTLDIPICGFPSRYATKGSVTAVSKRWQI